MKGSQMNDITRIEDRVRRKRMRIAERVRELLESTGKSQRAFAKEVGLQESYLSRILAGEANLNITTICAIEDALDKTILDVRLERLKSISLPQINQLLPIETDTEGLFFFGYA